MKLIIDASDTTNLLLKTHGWTFIGILVQHLKHTGSTTYWYRQRETERETKASGSTIHTLTVDLLKKTPIAQTMMEVFDKPLGEFPFHEIHDHDDLIILVTNDPHHPFTDLGIGMGGNYHNILIVNPSGFITVASATEVANAIATLAQHLPDRQ